MTTLNRFFLFCFCTLMGATWSAFAAPDAKLGDDAKVAISENGVNGIWWQPEESGWGLSIERGNRGVVFAVWFTYDKSGRPTWYHMPAGQPTDPNVVEGDVYHPTGPSFALPVFDPSQVQTGPPVGRFRIEWQDDEHAVFTVDVEGVHTVKSIQPYLWNYLRPNNGIFWNPKESGWGFARYSGFTTKSEQNLANVADFAVWFTYDENGPTWFVMPSANPDRMQNFGTYTITGAVYHPVGPPLAPVFDPAQVSMGNAIGTFKYGIGYDFQGPITLLHFNLRNASGIKQMVKFRF